ncbi:bifunctional hydroxymethylpyrimidine kinase/phosphomethylpyrimidine kinase [Pararhizobium sp. YC-54]|uniref:bifunctional hydroxymethylpyrimidine kinase/phosphomethylpyrimidine kinase n=1 Tax=Pararhizobium sp. YC-54 TaxID=2986920 RepID=UPI0021F6F05C|nr:bifunctional hydroxymethylpyrimidine kinase/phosphomethylpyrimidine kinase [Pararhizobium sp. YC-54]MCV9998821.1 bifunctional hydroxymethylpyrimidine kinase/phosphomethylpyrimidine kinase [Pararhizobium sp. YC-54]
MRHVLAVAGSDSSGGAGIVRDIETLAAFGVKASVAITAVTVQTHDHVQQVDAVAPDRVAQQMRAALSANPIAAIKIGMLATSATIAAVVTVLADYPGIPVVLDPVLVSTSGRALLTPDAMDDLRELFRSCTLITPNLPELSVLAAPAGTTSSDSMADQARSLLTAGAKAVLVKGGHGDGAESIDILFQADHAGQSFASPRLAATMRGTGCTLASAIAARLALGDTLSMAVAEGKAFVHRMLRET